jgi:Multicopper oxidase
MNRTVVNYGLSLLLMAMTLCLVCPVPARAVIDGLTVTSGTPINFTAMEGHIRTGDGDSVYMWGYSADGVRMQYPGPTLIVTEGQTVTVNLTNRLPLPVSLVFPGQTVTTATVAGTGITGLLTTEVPPDKGVTTVSYTFTATSPGTYTYYSGTRSDLEVDLGLFGVIVVRPAAFDPNTVAGRIAYNDPPIPTVAPAPAATAPFSSYDREYLFLLSEIDVNMHRKAETGWYLVDTTTRHPVTFLLNGRTFPDTMAEPNVNYLPSQPYNCIPMMHPGERVLMRMVGGGRDMHPYHTHGQNHWVIARDGRLLNSSLNNSGATPDSPNMAISDFTTTVIPGETSDAIWGPWSGARLGWDVYGDPNDPTFAHTCNGLATFDPANPNNPAYYDPATSEYCPDHGKPIPVQLPPTSDISFGVGATQMYSGSPFLGHLGPLPPASTLLNPLAGIAFMWHSHAERELTTNNIFIGGISTMALVTPFDPTHPIDQYKP